MTVVERQLAEWSVTAQATVVRFGGLLGRVWATSDIGEPNTDSALMLLSNACFSTGDSALWLASQRKPWDAEILLRAVYEGTAKFAFLCHTDPSERQRRVEEFAEILPELGRLRDSERASSFLGETENSMSLEWRPINDLVLPPEEVERIRKKHPRKARAALEQRWSFTELARAMNRSDVEAIRAFPTLLYGYAMGSHLTHMDWTGTGVVWERETRTPADNDAVSLAHGSRIIFDVTAMAVIRTTAAYRYKGLDHEEIVEALRATESLITSLRSAHEAFVASEYPAKKNGS